jgi:hypothetical protein
MPCGSRSSIVQTAGTPSPTTTDAEYFSTLGLRLLRGRAYTRAEVRDKARVAVVSEALARDFFPGEDPLGQPLSRVVEDEGDAIIIGVASNAITSRLRERREATIYQPIGDRHSAGLLIRTESSPSLYLATIRGALQPPDPKVRLEVTPVSEGLARQLGESRVLASLATTLAAVALCLAIVGLHGVTAFVINQRSQEITLRIALGASRRDVLQMLLADSLRPVLLGLGAGIIVAVGTGRLIAGPLWDRARGSNRVGRVDGDSSAVGDGGDHRSCAPGRRGRSGCGVEAGVGRLGRAGDTQR